jgi:hypothetical protein
MVVLGMVALGMVVLGLVVLGLVQVPLGRKKGAVGRAGERTRRKVEKENDVGGIRERGKEIN